MYEMCIHHFTVTKVLINRLMHLTCLVCFKLCPNYLLTYFVMNKLIFIGLVWLQFIFCNNLNNINSIVSLKKTCFFIKYID